MFDSSEAHLLLSYGIAALKQANSDFSHTNEFLSFLSLLIEFLQTGKVAET